MALAEFVLETWLRHPPEDVLEAYALRRLREPEVASLEEHLLACESCQEKLGQIDEFVSAMKQAAPGLTAPSRWWSGVPDALRSWRYLTPGRAALAGALLLLCGIVIVELPQTPAPPPFAITLTALRGGDSGASPTAPAGRPLTLAFEIPDVADCGGCRVEIVTDSGRTVWSGGASFAEGRVAAVAPVALGAGMYWVRLHIGEAGPAREFGLRLR